MSDSRNRRRSFTRSNADIPLRRVYLVATEGTATEPDYFTNLRALREDICIKIVCRKNRSNPVNVLKNMDSYIKKWGLSSFEAAWLVVDKDHWTNDQLKKLIAWTKLNSKFNLALSNPKFEFWLLLHFELGKKVTSGKNCEDRLKKYIPDFNKSLAASCVKEKQIKSAIQRARKIDTPPCTDWPRKNGSTVYKLVEKILG